MGTIAPTVHCRLLFSSSHELTLPFLRGCLLGLNKLGLGSVEKHVEGRCLPYPYRYKKASENHVCMGYEVQWIVNQLICLATFVHECTQLYVHESWWQCETGINNVCDSPQQLATVRNMYTACMHVQWSCLMCWYVQKDLHHRATDWRCARGETQCGRCPKL